LTLRIASLVGLIVLSSACALEGDSSSTTRTRSRDGGVNGEEPGAASGGSEPGRNSNSQVGVGTAPNGSGAPTSGGSSPPGETSGGGSTSAGGTTGGGMPSTGGGMPSTGGGIPNGKDSGAPSTSGPCGALPICDDFESAAPGGPPNPAIWSVVRQQGGNGNSTLAIDESQAHSGKRSVKIVGGPYFNEKVLFSTTRVQAIGPVVFGRFYVRFANELGDGHVTFAAFHDNVEGKDLRFGGQSRILMWNRESDDATLPSLSPVGISMSSKPPANAWRCMEFQVDGPAGGIRTWVDGAEIPGLVVDASKTADADEQWKSQKPSWSPKLVDAKFGWESYSGDTNTVWFDDVALGPKRIGCGG
jgi:hypothetical protein